MNKQSTYIAILAAALLGLAACGGEAPSGSDTPVTPAQTTDAGAGTSSFSIPFEAYELDNGLSVVLHVDRSNPLVAINIAAHVGSSRELPGRTGFAHLFEHLLFLDSENLGYKGLDELNTRIGGEGTNGFTTNDMTQYFQAVPADALEKVIWAEADKLGYFINTVTQPVIDNEKQVVKNEKRQRVDNQPYGHRFFIVGKALYPDDHPYNWQVIGSLDDLEAATLQDVKDFYRKWYVPNNVTLTITGDFQIAEAKRLVEKYFAEIPRGEEIAPFQARPVQLSETKTLFHEDNFATVPELAMVWPSVPEYHADRYALEVLAEYLSSGKRAPLNEVLIDETKLTSAVTTFHFGKELAGEFYLILDGKADADLDLLPPAIETAFSRFEANGISEADLARIKAGLEVSFYQQIQSALGKAIQLSGYDIFTGDPGYLTKDIQGAENVTTEDVMRVYNTYIKDKPHVITNFVPKGQPDLALEGAVRANIVEEKVVQGAESAATFDPTARNFERTASSFDRTIEPPFGAGYTLPAPDIWRATLSNGIEVFGVEDSETPLVNIALTIDAGRGRGDPAKPAIPSLTASLLQRGTVNKTPAELEDAIKSLGSTISIGAGTDQVFVTATTLKRNFQATVDLIEEMLTEPRWDTEEFDILKRRRLDQIDASAGNPNAIAGRELAKLSYPEGHILSFTALGTRELLETVTLEDVKAFHASTYSPAGAALRVVGDIDAAGVRNAFAGLGETWTTSAPPPVSLAPANPVEGSKLYFYDVPGSKQSVLRITRPSLSATDEDYALAEAVNLLLGNVYTSDLNTQLRIDNGYTYGIGSFFSGQKTRGEFSVFSSVRSNVTYEALALIRDILENYGPEFTQDKLATMKSAILKGQALEGETSGAKLGALGNISQFGYPDDYQARDAARIEALTLEGFKDVADKYIRSDAMIWLVVGDAETQLARLADLGFGEPILLNPSK